MSGFFAGSIGTRRFRILALYAVLVAGDELLRCAAQGGKIVFATQEKAETATRELVRLTATSRQRAYRCPVGVPEHWHLTKRLRERNTDGRAA